MKQVLALISVFLVLMLVITTVMAVGNMKQSQQMAQRAQTISSLRAELRKTRQEQQTLSDQLETERTASKAIRTERDALNKRYSNLMTLLRNQPAGYSDVSPLPVHHFAHSSSAQPSGEGWLQAQALQQMLTRIMQDKQATQKDPQRNASTVQASPSPSAQAVSALAVNATDRIALSTVVQITAVPTPASTIHRLTPSVFPTPTATSTPAPTIQPATIAPTLPLLPPTSQPAATDPLSVFQQVLITGLNQLQRVFHWMEGAIGQVARWVEESAN